MYSKTVPDPSGSCPPCARARLNCPTHHVPVCTITVARSRRREDLAHDGRARSDGTPRSAPAAGRPGEAGSGLPLQHLRPGAPFVGYFGHNSDALVDCRQDWHGPGHGNQDLAILIEHAEHLLEWDFPGGLELQPAPGRRRQARWVAAAYGPALRELGG
ncbi:barstar family protein [Streptomyces virginiae]|uniref:barstar family protein n=1 Tax=Streptomyces virginiae TaxID=1961 RepID=UPI0037F316FD